jgi:hypothetical protein
MSHSDSEVQPAEGTGGTRAEQGWFTSGTPWNTVEQEWRDLDRGIMPIVECHTLPGIMFTWRSLEKLNVL